MRVAVVGHVEWVDFVRVEALPREGEIVRALEFWEEPAGGGGVAAVQLAKLSGSCTLYTALGDDPRGRQTREDLARLGVRVEAATRHEPTRRGVTFVDATGERTITVMGKRLEAAASDPLPWSDLESTAAVYLCAADPEAIRLARRARILVATSRILPLLREARVELDALVGSARDPSEIYEEGMLDPPPRLVVRTEGGAGGTFQEHGGACRRYRAESPPSPIVDTYGCGDNFGAGLAWALADGRPPQQAVAFAASCGASALTGRGAFAGQLRLAPHPAATP